MGARHLLIGLDGADLDLVQRIGAGRLPNLHRLMAQGAYAPLQSVSPPATLPNWTTLLTGVGPGRHGVFDFTTRDGYDVRFTAGSVREAPTIAARLDRMGKRCACLYFPATWPPEKLEHGVFISGWDAPVAFEADRSFVWPPSLHEEITRRFGPQRFDDVDEFDADSPGWHARLSGKLCERVGRRAQLGSWLLKERDWDLFALYFGESDTASHHLWALHDGDSPRRPAHVAARDADGLARVYAALDDAVGELLRSAGADVEVTVASDHGFGGASDKVLYINRALAGAGLLRFKRRGVRQRVIGAVKEAALTHLPPRVRERVFRMAGTRLPSLLESRARFGPIEMGATRVFSDELNYFPALHINLRGREPRGVVEPAEVDALVARVREVLCGLCDPWSGAPVVSRVVRREELFSGDFVARAPDLLLELHLDAGYSYNLMPSGSAPPASQCSGPMGSFRRLSPEEYLGRKGRSLQGSHRDRGLFVAHGPRVRVAGQVEAAMADVTATLLARMGVDAGVEIDGRSIDAILRPRRGAASPLAAAAPMAKPGMGDQGRVARRLRMLGYID